jgi:hypothetical protein
MSFSSNKNPIDLQRAGHTPQPEVHLQDNLCGTSQNNWAVEPPTQGPAGFRTRTLSLGSSQRDKTQDPTDQSLFLSLHNEMGRMVHRVGDPENTMDVSSGKLAGRQQGGNYENRDKRWPYCGI